MIAPMAVAHATSPPSDVTAIVGGLQSFANFTRGLAGDGLLGQPPPRPPGVRLAQVNRAALTELTDLAQLPAQPGDVAAWRSQLEHDVNALRAADSGLRAQVRATASP